MNVTLTEFFSVVGRYLLLFVLCAVILTVGMFCERFLTPLLFRLALGEVLPS